MIKLFAAILMAVDHIGAIFFPDLWILRAFGRLSMPIYAFGLSIGFQHAWQKKQVGRYIIRLALFAAISQLPYAAAFQTTMLNIGVTWLLALIPLASLEWRADRASAGKESPWIDLVASASVVGAGMLGWVLNCDYAAYGVLVPFCLRAGKDWTGRLYFFSAWTALQVVFGHQPLIQALSILSIPILGLLSLCEQQWKEEGVQPRIPKAVWYFFYPAHLALYAAIRA